MKKNVLLIFCIFVSSSSIFSSILPVKASQEGLLAFSFNLNPRTTSKIIIAGGVQVTSKTLYNKDGVRIDVENPAPDKRPGQVHLQTGSEKYIYDPTTGQFKNAPSKIQKLLANPEIAAAVQKGVEKYLEIIPWKP